MAATLAHRGICVSDMDRSREFYARALGFSSVHDNSDGIDLQPLGQLTGQTEAKVTSQLVRDCTGVTLELVKYLWPPSSGPRQRRPLNQCGLTHFCFWVPRIEDSARLIETHGGTPHWHTLVVAEEMKTRVMYCSDPDGVRIELGERAGQPPAFLHSALCAKGAGETIRFYCELLGFRLVEQLELKQHASWLARLMELQDVSLSAHVIASNGNDRIEVLECHRPEAFGTRQPEVSNRFGLSHMTFLVPDLAAAAAVLRNAGTCHTVHSLAGPGSGAAIVCNDPEGTTLILMECEI
jgi:catechol 2,3-dioxygenase-like lactoylglutathione lyase family enzyme